MTKMPCSNEAETESQTSTVSTGRALYEKFKTKDWSYYTDNTTVHGVKYLGEKKRPKLEKVYWIIIFIVCCTILGLFLSNIADRWQKQFFVLVEDEFPTPVYKIPFPAVTICPQAKIKSEDFSLEQMGVLSEMREMNSSAFENYYKKMKIAQQVCPTVQRIIDNFGDEHQLKSYHVDLLYEISPSLSDIIKYVEMPDSCEMKLSKMLNLNLQFSLQNETFSTILTNEGVCFAYNLPADILRYEDLQTSYQYHDITTNIKGWDYEQGYYSLDSFPKASCSAGDISSLRIELISSHPDIKTICQSTTVGYKIILHSPAVYPTTFETYIGINHETMTKIKVTPVKITTEENLRSYTPQERRCYFNNERYLQFYQFYNQINCKLECFVNFTIQHYGCAHFAFPRTDDVPICGAKNSFLHIYEFVNNIDSLVHYLNEFRDANDGVDSDLSQMFDDFQTVSCDCLTECNSLEYEYTIVTETFKNDDSYPDIKNSFNESENSPTIIDIFWDRPKFVGRTRKQYYTLSDMVSNFGGLIGLFMGASVLSVFEMIYLCIVRRIDPSHVEQPQPQKN